MSRDASRRRAWWSVALLAGAVLAALPGCGYSLRGHLPAHIRTVGVPVFVNRTTEPAVEGLLTRAIVDAFARNGRLRVVRPEEADAVLDGEVISYTIDSIAFDPRANVRQYRLTVGLNLKMRDVRNQTALFEATKLEEYADFQVVGVVSETIVREESALLAAAVSIARAVVNLAVERI